MNTRATVKNLFWILAITYLFVWPFQAFARPNPPSSSFPVSTPEAQGADSEQLAKVFDYVRDNEVNIHSIVLVRNGHLILDAYFYPNAAGVVHDVASVTKSITSILVGMAIDKGCIKTVRQPVLDFFPGRTIANLDEKKKRLTVEHLLTMRSGFCRDFEHGERQLDDMRRTKDWVQYMLDQPILTEPGTEFAYCTGGTHLLSAILTQATGMNELAFAQKYLFEPLGIREVTWPADPQGNNTGGFDLKINSLDLAKIGYLLLNKGVWNGQQIVSPKWIEQSTTMRSSGDDLYGYLWWSPRGNPDLIEGRGRGGQRLVFSRQRDIVLVFTGCAFNPGDVGAIILPALRSKTALPDNPQAFARLQAGIQSASQEPEPKPVPPLPPLAGQISGKEYQFEPNQIGLKSFSLVFSGGSQASLELSENDHRRESPIGLDGRYRISQSGPSGLPEAWRGRWVSSTTFELVLNEFANNHLYRLTFSFPFGANLAKVQLVEPTMSLNETLLARCEK